MISTIRQFFAPQHRGRQPSVPQGERVYAIGDVHGCLDLFNALVAAIEADDHAQDPADTTIVLLGDLVDRGPDSAGVIAAARQLQARRKVRILCGNHEEMFLASFEVTDVLRHFLRFGGRQTIMSYMPYQSLFPAFSIEEVETAMRDAVPAEDIDFMRGFEDHIQIGDYLFVHAGIRPGIPLDDQEPQDIRWIREPFLNHGGQHDFMVVHGHTISEDAEFRANRIGIDTGAFMSGRLTAIGLEGTKRWLIEARDDMGRITTHMNLA